MTIAITGSGGQLGSGLLRLLGSAALGLDLPEFDLTDRPRVLSALRALRPRAIDNTAAYTRVDEAETAGEHCRAINSAGVAQLAEACRELDCVLVQISTDYVFGGDAARRRPYREDEEPCPQGVYARSKRDGERQAGAWSKHFIVRTCGLYGQPGPRSGSNFVATMLRLAEHGQPLRVVADQCCTPSYVPHVARAIGFLRTTEAYGIYHVTNLGATTWHGLAVEIFRQAGLDVTVEPITTAQYRARAQRPAYSVLDTSKYHSLPGRPEMPTWQEALREYLVASCQLSVANDRPEPAAPGPLP
jgi:dTDP-4-dehydrorhamnose reductase